MQYHCQNCHHHWETSGDVAPRFCEECGGPLTFAEPESSESLGVSEPATDYSQLAALVGGRGGNSHWDLSAKSRAMAEQLGTYQPPSPIVSCEHLKVEYRENLYFLAGAQIPFELKITPLLGDVKGVFVWFSPQIAGERSVVYDIPVDARIRSGWSFTLHIPYLSGETVFGIVPFRFYFGCVLEHGMKYYQMTVNHQIFHRDQSVDSMVSQITINASEAGTINANLNDLLRTGKPRTVNELLEQLNRSAKNLAVQKLEETLWRPEHETVHGKIYECDRLTLTIGDHHYQIIGKNHVKLGREPDCVDLVIADMLSAKSLREHPNNTVSGVHTEIHYCGENVLFFDRSRHGTFINGIRPRSEGITVPNEAVIEFGDIHWRMEIQHCEHKPVESICKACLGHGVKSLTFARKDRVRESYMLVWECCELGYLDRRLAGFAVYRRNGGFILRSPDNQCQYLVPGRRVTCQDTTLEVSYFKQFGF